MDEEIIKIQTAFCLSSYLQLPFLSLVVRFVQAKDKGGILLAVKVSDPP